MTKRVVVTLFCVFQIAVCRAAAQRVSITGAADASGFNAGSVATLRASIKGLPENTANYTASADIHYAGSASRASIPMTRQGKEWEGGALYTGQWNIPIEAPTGLYLATVQLSDAGRVIATAAPASFAVYRKLARILSITLDKTFYSVGEPIECEITLQNLSGRPLRDLRVEFSNPNYPWIATFSGEASLSGKPEANPMLALKVLRSNLSLPARGTVALPMEPAGTAAFLQGTQQAVLGAGAPPRHDKVPPPEVDRYTVALWNHDHTVLYDMQFSPIAIVRAPGQSLPKPYSDSFTHPYNDEIDFKNYRHFYSPGEMSGEIAVDHAHTLYRPGDTVRLRVQLRNSGNSAEQNGALRVAVKNSKGAQVATGRGAEGLIIAPGGARKVAIDTWKIPASLSPGVYSLALSTWGPDGAKQAETSVEIAVNRLPGSILVFCPHEDDELPWAGLIRAAVEAGIPVHVIFFTGGDVGECERYYGKPCGPNEAREFGMVRMEESKEALEHIGLPRSRDIFLGLPDGGSQEIWFHHRDASHPFLSVYLACDHAPYEHILLPNLPYARRPVIDLVKKLIVEYHPALIATPHPDERHVDHRTANWFVVKACQELLRERRIDPATVVVADQAYGAGGYHPAPYHYQRWVVHLSGEAAALKQEMSWIYQSQDGNLSEGMKRMFDELPREEVHYRILDWQQHEGWNEQP
ncbi:MAG: PIG-L family deacetylase [Terriglobia bacterium]